MSQQDYLDEDPVINSQQYVVLSYAFSSQKTPRGDYLPLLKIRGSYRTLEECDARIKLLADKTSDPEGIAILKTEVGKWIGLYTYEELQKQDEIDVEYRNEELNEIMKGLRQSSLQEHEDFYKRLKESKEQLQKDGTKEGQEELNSKKEHPVSVYHRYLTHKNTILELQRKIEETQKLMDEAEQKMNTDYTLEELEEAKNIVQNANNQGLSAPMAELPEDSTDKLLKS